MEKRITVEEYYDLPQGAQEWYERVPFAFGGGFVRLERPEKKITAHNTDIYHP